MWPSADVCKIYLPTEVSILLNMLSPDRERERKKVTLLK